MAHTLAPYLRFYLSALIIAFLMLPYATSTVVTTTAQFYQALSQGNAFATMSLEIPAGVTITLKPTPFCKVSFGGVLIRGSSAGERARLVCPPDLTGTPLTFFTTVFTLENVELRGCGHLPVFVHQPALSLATGDTAPNDFCSNSDESENGSSDDENSDGSGDDGETADGNAEDENPDSFDDGSNDTSEAEAEEEDSNSGNPIDPTSYLYVTITNCVFRDNSADSASGYWGSTTATALGVYMYHGAVKVQDSVFEGNRWNGGSESQGAPLEVVCSDSVDNLLDIFIAFGTNDESDINVNVDLRCDVELDNNVFRNNHGGQAMAVSVQSTVTREFMDESPDQFRAEYILTLIPPISMSIVVANNTFEHHTTDISPSADVLPAVVAVSSDDSFYPARFTSPSCNDWLKSVRVIGAVFNNNSGAGVFLSNLMNCTSPVTLDGSVRFTQHSLPPVVTVNQNVYLQDVVFEDNVGAVLVYGLSDTEVTVTNCDFWSNKPAEFEVIHPFRGGGSQPTFGVFTVLGSTASGFVKISDTTFSGNEGAYGLVNLQVAAASIDFDGVDFHENVVPYDVAAIDGRYNFSDSRRALYISASQAAVSLHNTNFTACTGGGALIATAASVNVSNCHFADNLYEPMLMSGSDRGVMLSKGGGGGLGVAAFRNTLDLSDSEFRNNSAGTAAGGALWVAGDKTALATLTDSRVTLHNVQFADNHAAVGGAARIDVAGALSVTECTFENNVATGQSGGMHVTNIIQMVLFTNTSFDGNIGGQQAGAVTVRNTVLAFALGSLIERIPGQVQEVHFENCQLCHNTAAGAGALFIDVTSSENEVNGIVELENCTFDSNHATGCLNDCDTYPSVSKEARGGAAWINYASSLMVNECMFTNDTALHGGALYLESVSGVNVHESVFIGNGVIGIDAIESAVPGVSDQDVTDKSSGGAIHAVSSQVSIGRAVMFTQNTASYGGAVYVSETDVYMLNVSGEGLLSQSGLSAFSFSESYGWDASVLFADNVAFSAGGAVYMMSSSLSSSATLLDIAHKTASTVFVGNQATAGGAVAAVKSIVELSAAAFDLNAAVVSARGSSSIGEPVDCPMGCGGALCASDEPSMSVTLSAVLLQHNRATVGGALCLQSVCSAGSCDAVSDVKLEVQARGNYATKSGGVIYWAGSSFPDGPIIQCPDNQQRILPAATATASQLHPRYNFSYSLPLPAYNSLPCQSWVNNSVAPGGYGGNIASNARHIASGSELPYYTSGTEQAVPVLLLDHYGHWANQSVDAQQDVMPLEIKLQDASVFAVGTRADAVRGEAEFFFRMQAKQGVQKLVIQRVNAADGSGAPTPVQVTVYVRPCHLNEYLVAGTQDRCVPCQSNSYNFNTSGPSCTACPDNAICGAVYGNSSESGMLVPQEGFWHSNMFSGKVVPCVMIAACRYPNRDATLARLQGQLVLRTVAEQQAVARGRTTAAASAAGRHLLQDGVFASNVIVTQVANSSDDIKQEYSKALCAPGYEGRLCSRCADGYGTDWRLACRPCPKSRGLNHFYYGLSCLLTLVLLMVTIISAMQDKTWSHHSPAAKYTADENKPAADEPEALPGIPTAEDKLVNDTMTRSANDSDHTGRASVELNEMYVSAESHSMDSPVRPSPAALDATDHMDARDLPSINTRAAESQRETILNPPEGHNDGQKESGLSTSAALQNDSDHAADVSTKNARIVTTAKQDHETPKLPDMPQPVSLAVDTPKGGARVSIQLAEEPQDASIKLSRMAGGRKVETVTSMHRRRGEYEFILGVCCTKIMVSYLQVLVLISSVPLVFPDSLQGLFRFFGQLVSFQGEAASLDCSLSPSIPSKRIARTILTALAPVYVGVGVTIIWILVTMIEHAFKLRSWKPDSDEPRPDLAARLRKHLPRRLVLTGVAVGFFFYPTVIQALLNVFSCRSIDGKNSGGFGALAASLGLSTQVYWRQDMQYECYKGAHLALTWALAVPGLILYGVGFPLGVGLWLQLDKDLRGQFTRFLWSFYSQGYSQKYGYWESIVMLRKLVIVLAVVFFSNTQDVGIVALVVLMILFVALVAQQVAKPFVESRINRLERATLVVLLFTLYLSVYFSFDSVERRSRNFLSVSIVLLNVFMLVWLLHDVIALQWRGAVLQLGFDADNVHTMSKEEIHKRLVQTYGDRPWVLYAAYAFYVATKIQDGVYQAKTFVRHWTSVSCGFVGNNMGRAWHSMERKLVGDSSPVADSAARSTNNSNVQSAAVKKLDANSSASSDVADGDANNGKNKRWHAFKKSATKSYQVASKWTMQAYNTSKVQLVRGYECSREQAGKFWVWLRSKPTDGKAEQAAAPGSATAAAAKA